MIEFLKDRGFAIGYVVMLAGVAVLLTGFGVDAWLHVRDPGLAAEEGLFTLTNPGHALVVIGLVTIVAGALVGPYSRWILSRRSRVLPVVIPVSALAVAITLSTGFAMALNSMTHNGAHSHPPPAAVQIHDPLLAQHDNAATEHVPADVHDTGSGHAHSLDRILPENLAFVEIEEGTFHEPPNDAPVTESNISFARQFLLDARAGTEQYQDVNAALQNGYIQITQDLPLIGAHFFNAAYVGSLDPAHPAVLLYESDGAGGWSLVGLSYMLFKQEGVDTPPETPFGGLVKWHYHTDLCFGPGEVTIAASAAECTGQYVPETPWLLHVWVWKDSPEGVFDHMNSLLQ